MQPWRRAIVEAGLTFATVAAATGKSVHTVEAYSSGARRPSPEWQAQVEQLARQSMEGRSVA